MELRADHGRRRLVLAARTPGLDAGRLQAVAGCSADLELLERPDPGTLAALGLTTAAIAWLRAPDGARVEADLRWLSTAAGR